MAGPAPQTRNWIARENEHKPKGLHIIVSGQVEVNDANVAPCLTESAERDPKQLSLALSIEKCGDPGIDAKVWKNAFFHKEVKANRYDGVTVRWDATLIAQFPVLDDREHHAQLAQQTKALNTKYQGKAVASPAGKPAAKRTAAKKAPKKAAKKAAKKAPKKAPKTAKKTKAVGGWAKGKKAKKSAKKSAKKTSALKRLVRKVVGKLTPSKKKKRK